MSPRDIRKGMTCTDGEGTTFIVLKEATMFLNEKGEKIYMDNKRKNKWWIKQIEGGKDGHNQPNRDCRMPGDDDAIMACFDLVWDNETRYQFKQPA